MAPRHDETAIGAGRWVRQQHIGVEAASSGFGGRDSVGREGDARRALVGEKPSLEKDNKIRHEKQLLRSK